jgi:hypothetical protein
VIKPRTVWPSKTGIVPQFGMCEECCGIYGHHVGCSRAESDPKPFTIREYPRNQGAPSERPQYIRDLPETDAVEQAYGRGIEQAIDWILDEIHCAEDAFCSPGLRRAVEVLREKKR